MDSPKIIEPEFKIENGIAKVKMICSQCGRTKYIPRDDWERYYSHDDSDFECTTCQSFY